MHKVKGKEVKVLVVESNEKETARICGSLRQAGIKNTISVFEDSQELMTFLFSKQNRVDSEEDRSFLLLLDINVPGIRGLEMLRRLKAAGEDAEKVSVIVVSDSKDHEELEKCRQLGYNNIVLTPIVYETFVEAIKKVGLFIMIVDLPTIGPKTGAEKGVGE